MVRGICKPESAMRPLEIALLALNAAAIALFVIGYLGAAIVIGG
jgi:hypothetical protein